jgi:hypothetical protein
MPHDIYVRFKPCHVAPSLGYDMSHIYVMPCHKAFKQGIGHATHARPRPCHVAHRLGLNHPTWHLGTT